MANPSTINWVASDDQAICLAQSLADAGFLAINGHLVDKKQSYNPFYEGIGVERVVTLTAGGSNLSNVNFTITGEWRGQEQWQTIIGPNVAQTVSTTLLFDKVLSIYADDQAIDVSAGLGNSGSTVWQMTNTFATPFQVGILTTTTGTVNYTFQITFDNPLQVQSPVLYSDSEWENLSGGVLLELSLPVRAYRLLVNNETTGSIIFSSQQPGI
ncbi:MAG TPA: hypothetical protein VHA52_09985 [Candidatus Babeliaceae bacterium]|nr:hypothetical protein [Candidatus Babeliaceae bacterium]